MSPEISVVIAAYNVERYIERAILSALDQQGVSVEVVVVDDCSMDNTWAVISSINDPRVKPIKLSKNSGPSASRNAGFASSTAPWLAVLDGDDAFLSGRLEKLVRRAAEASADIVVDNILAIREADGVKFTLFEPGRLSRSHTLDLATFILENRLFQKGYTFGYFKPIFSRAFMQKHRLAYDTGLRIGEDYMLLAEALACGAVCVIENTPLYQYTVRSGSISHRLSLEDIVRMSETDKTLLSRYTLDPLAMQAQKRRENSLKEAYAYTAMVDMIKRRNVVGTLCALKTCPKAARQLLRPVLVRAKRLFG